MKRLIILYLFSSHVFANISLEEIDLIRSLVDKDSQSVISNGTTFCNDYFSKKANSLKINETEFKNIFLCKFSKKRNRFYIYMLSVQKKGELSLKNFCLEILNKWPEILDHTDSKLQYQKKEYLSGFYIENFYYDKVLSFSNDYKKDQQLINNEINNFIIKNRKNFSDDNKLNNQLLEKEINKINKIYKKTLSGNSTNLELIIKHQLDSVLRYKIFINDVENFQSYSCNWKPGKGEMPYVKREKFSEFENI